MERTCAGYKHDIRQQNRAVGDLSLLPDSLTPGHIELLEEFCAWRLGLSKETSLIFLKMKRPCICAWNGKYTKLRIVSIIFNEFQLMHVQLGLNLLYRHMCVQAWWHWSKLCGSWLPGLVVTSWAPAQLQLHIAWISEHRKSKDGTRPLHWSPPAPVGVNGEGCLLAQSRCIASHKIALSLEISSLIWRLVPPWCNGSDSHQQLYAWTSTHIKCYT